MAATNDVKTCFIISLNVIYCKKTLILKGQTPFDVADESVENLLEELKQKQTNVSALTQPALTLYF